LIGMFLLVQTGFISDCVNYIDERLRTKEQVGKLEQYGYGYLLSQMANVPAVVSCLARSGIGIILLIMHLLYDHVCLGFIEHLIYQLWSELECGIDDLTSVFPRRFPSEPIGRYALRVSILFL
jgi:hypothetical protein